VEAQPKDDLAAASKQICRWSNAVLAQEELFVQGDLQECRPLLKWAGGKTQLLGEIIPKMPKKYGRYIEPFFGGGALFFAVRPVGGVIADSNPELVNLVKSSQAANLLVQELRDLVKAADPLLAEIAIEILQQAVQLEQRLNRIDSITRPEEKTE
jgi:hypothetical protein